MKKDLTYALFGIYGFTDEDKTASGKNILYNLVVYQFANRYSLMGTYAYLLVVEIVAGRLIVTIRETYKPDN